MSEPMPIEQEAAILRQENARLRIALEDCKRWLEYRLSSPAFVPEINAWINRIDAALSPTPKDELDDRKIASDALSAQKEAWKIKP